MLTYIEPCGWCSSSISSTKCPSTVDKSTKPCPNLSSSLSSTSLISNSGSISISTDSISSGKRERTSTCLIRSSLGHPNDYYTTKRIDELHERMDDIQISSFLKFINYHLSLKKDDENLHINDLVKDLSNGHVLIDLIEILSSTKLKREHGHTRFHSLTNVQYVLDYLKLHMQRINISPHEIVSGNRKQILALLWIIMKTFDFPGFRITNKNCFVENTLLGFGQDRSIIIKWLNNILNQSLHTKEIYIKDFYIQTWSNGYYLSIIIKYLIPLSIKYLTTKSFDYLKELNELDLFDKQRFQICLNLSNYCFNTITIINYTDKSEKSLFKYFTELQKNILIILKTNHIGKLIQNNPYTKQILDTVIQTTEHSSHIINDNEQYLVCTEDEKKEPLENKHIRLTMNSMGHSTSSSSDDMDESINLRTVEKSRLFNDEQEKMKLKRKNRWEKIDNVQSNFHMINGHNGTSKEETIDKSHNNTAEKLDQPLLLVEEIEQVIKDEVESDQPIVTTKDLEQFVSTNEQTTVADKEIEQMTIINVDDQSNEKLEQSTIEIEKPQQFVRSNEENNFEKSEQITVSQQEIEQSVHNNNSTITTIEEPTQSVILNEKLEQPTTEEPKQEAITSNEIDQQSVNEYENLEKPATEGSQQQTITSNEVDQQSVNEYEKLEQSATEEPQQQTITSSEVDQQSVNEYEKLEETEQSTAAIEEQKQLLLSNENIEQFHVEIEPSEQMTGTMIENEPSIDINEELKQSIVELEETQQFIISNKEDNKSTIEHEKLEQDTESQSSSTTNEKILEQPTSQESLQSLISNQEIAITPVENNDFVIINENLEQPTTEKSSQFIISNEENEQNTIKVNDNEILNTSNESLEKPIIDLEETKQFTVEHEKLDQSLAPIEKAEQVIENNFSESPSYLVSDEKPEQTLVTNVNNNSSTINEKLEQTIISVENNPSIKTGKKLEKSVVVESQQPIASNGQINKSATASSIQENQHFITSNEPLTQSTIVVKEPEQYKVAVELPVKTTATISKGNKYSDIVNKQSSKTNNESVQGTATFNKQDHSTVSKKKVISSIISSEKPKQSLITAEETKQVPFTSTVKESEKSEVSLEKQKPPTTVIEESCASAISNEETKKSPTKTKKSRRSNARKGRAKNSSVKTEHPQQPAVHHEQEEEEEEEEQEVESSLSTLSLTNIVQEQRPSLEIQDLSTIPKTASNNNTSINNENLQNSGALRSRKNKKKKTVATTTTTLIEKSSSPIIPTITPNRNLLVAIKESIHDRKIIGFKCVIFLVCLCFSIIIIVHSLT